MFFIQIIGFREQVIHARTLCLLLLDKLQGLKSTSLVLPLVYLLAGVENININQIMRLTKTKIYLPSPYKEQLVYISGKNIELAKNELLKLKCNVFESKVQISTQCIRWIQMTQLDYLHSLMKSFGIFLEVSNSDLKLFAPTNELLWKAEREVSRLQFVFQCVTLPLRKKWMDHIETICLESGCEISISHSISIYGILTSIRLALQKFMVLDSKISCCFKFLCSKHHLSFIQGKQMGKIKKLERQCNSYFEFIENQNVEVLCHSRNLKDGLFLHSLFCAELPVEMSMYLPEYSHHKMIGGRGLNIKNLSSLHNVYLRFSNSEEHKKSCGYFTFKHNVYALTLAKNAHILENVCNDVILYYHNACRQLCRQDNKFMPRSTCLLRIPSFLHLHLLPFLDDLESKLLVEILIPNMELASCLILIYGTADSQKKAIDNIYLILDSFKPKLDSDYHFDVLGDLMSPPAQSPAMKFFCKKLFLDPQPSTTKINHNFDFDLQHNDKDLIFQFPNQRWSPPPLKFLI